MEPYFEDFGVTLYLGDCIDVMAQLPENSIDTIICDPPYGLSSRNFQCLNDSIMGRLSDVVFPNLDKGNALGFEDLELAGIPLCRSALGFGEVISIIKSWVCVPKSPVDLDSGVGGRDEEVDTGDIPSRFTVPDAILVDCVDTEFGKFLGDYVLDLGDTGEFSRRYGNSNLVTELFAGGFSVPCVPVFDPGSPSALAGLGAVILSHNLIGLRDDALCKTDGASIVMTPSGAVNTFMLRLDLRGGSLELCPTYRASHDDSAFQFAAPKLVRTGTTTGSLPPKFEPVMVSLVGFTTDGALPCYFHLWLSSDWAEHLKGILPRSGFMGKLWDAVTPSTEAWSECYRVLKPGGSLLAFGGTRTWHRLAVAIEEAGFELRDTLCWLFGSGFPKGHDISKAIDKKMEASREIVATDVVPGQQLVTLSKESGGTRPGDNYWTGKILGGPVTDNAKLWDGWNVSLKPAFEPIILAMKPRDGTFADNALKWGVAGLWIDGGRIGTSKDVPASPSRSRGNSLSGSVDGSLRRMTGDEGGFNPNIGRWPANVILSHTPECRVVGTRNIKGDQRGECSGKRPGGFANVGADKGDSEPNAAVYGDEEIEMWECVPECPVRMLDEQTGVLKSGACPNGFRGEFKANVYGKFAENVINPETVYNDSGGASRFFYCAKTSKRERTADGTVENKHPTVKPLALMRYLCRLTKTPTGGVVLDPFAGSGTTLIAAVLEGRQAIGIEMNEEYCKVAIERVKHSCSQPRQLGLPLES